MKHNINRWIFEIPASDVQEENGNGNESGGVNPCFICGKEINRNSKKVYQVHLLTNGNLVSTDQEFSDKDDQGFFNVGAECKNKLPNNFIF